MAEQDPAPDAPAKDPKGPGPEQPDHKAEAEKWKGFARKHEDAAKAAQAELARLKADSDASKSDAEKQANRLAALEAKVAEETGRAMRAEVASEKQLPAKLAKRLQGTTREELEADADELLASIKPTKAEDDDDDRAGKPTPRVRPRPRLTGGGDPSHQPEELNPRKLAAQIPRR